MFGFSCFQVRILNVFSVNCVEQTFSADFILVASWHDPSLIDEDPDSVVWEDRWNPVLNIKNGFFFFVCPSFFRCAPPPFVASPRSLFPRRSGLSADLFFFPLSVVLGSGFEIENLDHTLVDHIRLADAATGALESKDISCFPLPPF